MNGHVKEVLRQLDDLLAAWDSVPLQRSSDGFSTWKSDLQLETRMRAAIERFAPLNSAYLSASKATVELRDLGPIAKALRADYADGRLATLGELIHADIFSDLLDAAEHLLKEKYKDAAAVMVGGVLESHLRQLTLKNGLDINMPDGKPKMGQRLNEDLAKAQVYNSLESKQVTAWLDLRNKAAHGHYGDYTADQVQNMLDGVQGFMVRWPA